MSIDSRKRSKLRSLFKKYKEIKLVYLFGSHARGEADQSSDYDFAVYVDPKKKDRAFDILLELSARIGLVLKSNNYDVVVINLLDNNVILKNNIVHEGIVVYEVKGYRLNLELSIVGEYRDFRILESQYYPE